MVQALVCAASHCPDLVTLECAGLSLLTDAGFIALARSCHKLEQMVMIE